MDMMQALHFGMRKGWLSLCEDCVHSAKRYNEERIVMCKKHDNKTALCTFEDCPLTDSIRKTTYTILIDENKKEE